ncbi:MAG: tetratricopeptide repeat protein [Myxococcota bacterium]
MNRLGLVLALTCAMSSFAHAQEEPDRGRLHFQAGASYYEAGDYEDALREFQRAYELSQRDELFYNLSLCHQQLGNLEQASSFLRQYLESVSDIPNRANLERRLENFQERMQAPDDDPGPIVAPPEEEEEDDPEVGGANVPAIVGFSIAGAGALMLGVSGGLALAKRGELDDEECRPNCPSSDVDSLRRRAIFADIGLGLAAAGAVVGVIFLIVGGGDDDSDEARVRVEPYADRHSAGASIGGRF